MIQFDGKLDNPMGLLKWLTELDNLKIDGRIEEVQRGGIQSLLFHKDIITRQVGIPLLEMILEKEKDVFALLYEEGDRRAVKIIAELEGIDDNLENDKIIMLKCSDKGVDDHFGLGYLPRLVYFEGDGNDEDSNSGDGEIVEMTTLMRAMTMVMMIMMGITPMTMVMTIMVRTVTIEHLQMESLRCLLGRK